jgi:hypothetical protein
MTIELLLRAWEAACNAYTNCFYAPFVYRTLTLKLITRELKLPSIPRGGRIPHLGSLHKTPAGKWRSVREHAV